MIHKSLIPQLRIAQEKLEENTISKRSEQAGQNDHQLRTEWRTGYTGSFFHKYDVVNFVFPDALGSST